MGEEKRTRRIEREREREKDGGNVREDGRVQRIKGTTGGWKCWKPRVDRWTPTTKKLTFHPRMAMGAL